MRRRVAKSRLQAGAPMILPNCAPARSSVQGLLAAVVGECYVPAVVRRKIASMKLNVGCAVVVLVLVAGAAALGADIAGTVTLKGTPPPERPITEFRSDVNCGPLRSEVPTTRFYTVGPKRELADVVVSIKGLTGKSTGESAPPIVIDQVGCEFLPYVSACQTKQKVVVKNSDPVMHNVHVGGEDAVAQKRFLNKERNLGMLPKAPDLTFTFDAPEDFLRFTCDVHRWMFAYVSVFDHPYFAVTGKDGSFKIANVPVGKYTIEARHRKAGAVTKEVEVKDENVKLDLTVELK